MNARQRCMVREGEVSLDVIVEGAGPAVVLLPSLGRDSEDYDPVAEGLAGRGYRVLRPQPRGLGGSRGPVTGLTLADYADDVAAVLVALEAVPAVIVGHAFGNWVARMTAVRYPGLVRGVVIAAAAARSYPPRLTESIRRIVDPRTPADQRLVELQATFFSPGNDARVWLDGWHREVRDAQFAAYQATPKNLWWGAGEAPLLDLQAADDPFLPPESREELRGELGARVSTHLVANASHALLPEQPEAVVEAIAGWIAGLPADDTQTERSLDA